MPGTCCGERHGGWATGLPAAGLLASAGCTSHCCAGHASTHYCSAVLTSLHWTALPLPRPRPPARRLGGRLACLDMSAPALAPLLMPGLEVARTVLEADLGQPLADVNYFSELAGRKPAERLFVCLPGD
jgi:hypothetical protein